MFFNSIKPIEKLLRRRFINFFDDSEVLGKLIQNKKLKKFEINVFFLLTLIFQI